MGSRGALDSRTATFVLGDVVGSTRLWAEQPENMPERLAALDTIVDHAVATCDGERPVEQGEGDSFVAIFARAADALWFAIDVQRELRDGELDVRIAIHTGDADRRDDGRWLGPALNRCARLRAIAAGGQVLISAATTELVIDSLPQHASLRDLGRHRLRDLATPERVRQLCHPDLIADFAPLRSLDHLPNNLPVQLTSFVGRDDEIAAIGALLGEHRLVTLTGAGGAGKTRLALHVVAERLDDAPDGVWLADLAGIVDGDLVPVVLAQAMGVTEQPLQPIADTVTYRLADASAVVVLDNCEHLLDASSALADKLLRSCPDVRVVATSREPLGVDGEASYRVPSLAEPESIRLFTERATAARPTFQLDERTLDAVASICQRLDGLPLAIELAAARVRAMAPAEIAAQLDDRFRLLSAGRRGSLPRQRTLEASVQWSHDLLTEHEQIVLRRLSVFAGGFTLAAAERVVSGDGIDEWAVVDLVTSLVDRSLVQPEDDGEHTRYRLLETVRVFAAQRLADAGEVEPSRDRHLAWAVHFATELEPRLLNGPTAMAGRADLAGELDNLRAALDWATETADAASGLRILCAGTTLWYTIATETYRRTTALLALPGGDPHDRVTVQLCAGSLAFGFADMAGVHQLTEAATHLATELGDEVMLARAKWLTAYDLFFQLDESAVELMVDAVRQLDTLGDAWFLTFTAPTDGMLLTLTGDIAAGRNAIERAIERARAFGDPIALGWTLGVAAACAVAEGDAHAARRHARLALDGLSLMPGTVDEDMARATLAWTECATGDHDAALVALDAELARARTTAMYPVVAWAGLLRVWVGQRAGEPWNPELATEAGQWLAVIGYVFGPPMLAAIEAEQRTIEGDPATAVRLAEHALELSNATIYARLGQALAMIALARATLALGDVALAEDRAYDALTHSVTTGEQIRIAESFDVLAAVAVAVGSHLDAARMLGASDALRDDLGWARGVPEQSTVDHLADSITGAIGIDQCETARAEGRAMTRDDAIAFVTRGRGKRKRATFGWSSLTPTELDVVRLVTEGLRNKDIAEKLLMSPATVKTHLTHVFAKLGVTSRTELAGQATQRASS